jgi:uncharacterized protein (TIGR03437 family)
MRWNGLLISILAAAILSPGAAQAAAFGQVVAIGGNASDIALDESRGLLYIANFGAGTVQKMSLTTFAIQSSFNVAPQPAALAISPDSQYLLVAHYANGATSPQGSNLITLIHLSDGSRLTFTTGDPPLGVAFFCTNPSCLAPQGMIVTTNGILHFDPVSGQTTVLSSFANLANTLPVAQGQMPSQILQTALTTSADGMTIWGIGGAGTGNQLIYKYDARSNSLGGGTYVTSPSLLPRVSVAADGSTAMIGYSLLDAAGNLQGRYPNVIANNTITGSAIDSVHGIIYGQFPDANQPSGPATPTSTPAGSTSSVKLPALLMMDSNNLAVRDRLIMPEDIVGRSILNKAGSALYAISESGVMILPVGSLKSYNRVRASVEDLLITTNFCNRSSISQTFTVSDPGGNHTDVFVTTSQPGVSISQSSGVTPATITVSISPAAVSGSGGTTPVSLTINSSSAINQPSPVRLLFNNPDPSQRGTVVDQPGVLSDILPDAPRNRYYVLRQDQNQLLIYDGNSNSVIATLPTATSPTMMALTPDQNYLMVGHNDSEYVMVYDLNAMAPVSPIVLPGGHYARSIASSNAAILILARNEANGSGIIDSIDFPSRSAAALLTLGIYKNSVNPAGVLTASPNGAAILLASPDGNVMLYTASSNTFVASRNDITSLSGAFAASNYGSYVVGNNVFDASLVPRGTLSNATTGSSGFYFIDQGGFMTSASSNTSAGVMQRVANVAQNTAGARVLISEAPLLPTAASTAPSSGSSGTGSSGTGSGGSGSSGSGSSGSSSGTGTGTPTTTNGSGSFSAYALANFTRTVAPMANSGTVVVLTTSGITVLASNYDAAVAPPQISTVVNAANGKQPVAPGGLVSIYGSQMSPVNMATSQIPLPTALGDSCLSVNGTPVPLLFVSSQQINAQLPYNVSGSATLTVHTPGGISDNYLFNVQPAAPSVFQSGTAGPQTGLATILRADNSQLVTPTNPVHPQDTLIIFLTGMGQTTPQVPSGMPAPSNPLAQANIAPIVTLGGSNLPVAYAGLVPNEVGVYQINVTVPNGIPQGLSIPLNIDQGGASTTLNVRVVN